MAEDHGFTSEEMAVSENLGYPKAYAKLCRNKSLGPYNHGPPFTFMPYALQEYEAERARGLDRMFPVIDPKAKPTTKPKIFARLLWNQLSHLGNAGFDPAVIRVDAYGNVVYYHADSASPLAWDIDHWFPCSRGGLTVVSNLRILQRQACKRKKHKLEFLIPWWDFQLGVSVNQFLSIFASSNSTFRHRGFSFLFPEGEDHELNASQIVDSHSFPQHFFALKEEVGLAPAAIVESRRESRRESYYALSSRQVDYNRNSRPMTPIVASRKGKGKLSKENEDPQFDKNSYQTIVVARDSLKRREESARVREEMHELDNEENEMKLTNEEEKLMIQELELEMIKCRRKAEKCRRLAEAQCSYRTMLEKMIRDAMHQSVMYKEQIRLNQAATNALTARLEAQREICDAAEKELHKKYKHRDELEKEIRPEWDQGRKRSRIDDFAFEEIRDGGKPVLYLPANEQEDQEENEEEPETLAHDKITEEKLEEHNRLVLVALEGGESIKKKLEKLEISEGKRDYYGTSLQVLQETETEENGESRKQRGKGNVEKWLQMLLENNNEDMKMSKVSDSEEERPKLVQEDDDGSMEKGDVLENEATNVIRKGKQIYAAENGSTSFKGAGRQEQHKKEKRLDRPESTRALRRISSSPSLFLRKKKPTGNGVDDGSGELAAANRFFRTIKKAVKL